ncbi:DUF423 domain-containing protein [Compostibacter hankyongensis]|uniref:DUF423 domain-containing protein n=1 Tax=Compostibacter hankyongensis TaxID=1007089 RepID=A0ABP8G2C8_9BACT
MHRTYLIIAALLGALSVITGAFGAHGVKSLVTPDVLEIYETGVRYQFYHVFALLAVGILYRWYPGKAMSWAGILFIAGVVLFSGSLYLITLMKAGGKSVPTGIGLLTPLGGLLLTGGWAALLLAFLKASQG